MFPTPLDFRLGPNTVTTPPKPPYNNNNNNNYATTDFTTKRSVISSKRAAQNRASQRAFRQRKVQYIKNLEKQVQQIDQWESELEWLRKENKDLMKTVQGLERRLTELTGLPLQKPRPAPKIMFSPFAPVPLRRPQDVVQSMIPWHPSEKMSVENDTAVRSKYG
ncbi:hypothetical protein DFQ28_009843 [Apophysomyces sp. BC1034]|nr:hypothetical protein DFQ30_009411 [Apophysomyces sp. BC1015]KAG0176021.1 hypothetical protein DFQ29_006655 [Apophysomyces sp. BC1021]KAG0185171.1 hypothetical protein DFQ28_009843 [Apophysomyces sp. BC1034]